MSSILAQNPDATVSDALEGIPEAFITRRESLRMRALIGAVPASMLTEYDTAGLAAVLASEPDGKLADPDVVCGFTMRMSPKRIPVIAEFFLDYLSNGLPVMEEPAAPAPAIVIQTAPSASKKGGRSATQPRKKAGVPVTLAELRADTQSRGNGSLANRDGAPRKPKPAPRGRPVGSPADMMRLHRGVQE